MNSKMNHSGKAPLLPYLSHVLVALLFFVAIGSSEAKGGHGYWVAYWSLVGSFLVIEFASHFALADQPTWRRALLVFLVSSLVGAALLLPFEFFGMGREVTISMDDAPVKTTSLTVNGAVRDVLSVVPLVGLFNVLLFGVPGVLVRFLPDPMYRRLSRLFFYAQRKERVEYEHLAKAVDQGMVLARSLEGVSLERACVIESLNARSARLRDLNSLLLGGVLAVLVSTAVFVVFAGNVAERDTKSAGQQASLRRSAEQLDESLASKESELATVAAELAQAQALSKDANSAKKAKGEAKAAELEIKKKAVERRIASQQAELEKIRDALSRIETGEASKASESKDGATATALLVAAGITRFGVLVLSIYLVQILIGLYRYNAQVAAHYGAQSDALLLLGYEPAPIGDLIEKLKLQVTFGKPEASLPDKLTERLTELISTAMGQGKGPTKPEK